MDARGTATGMYPDRRCNYFFLMAPFTFAASSGDTVSILCVDFACTAAILRTSSSVAAPCTWKKHPVIPASAHLNSYPGNLYHSSCVAGVRGINTCHTITKSGDQDL